MQEDVIKRRDDAEGHYKRVKGWMVQKERNIKGRDDEEGQEKREGSCTRTV